jgi:hypothetical protein
MGFSTQARLRSTRCQRRLGSPDPRGRARLWMLGSAPQVRHGTRWRSAS